VSPERDLVTDYAFGPGVSGWQVAWSRLNPFAPSMRVPSLFAIMLRTAELNDVYRRQEKRELADLFIAPPLEQFSMLNFRPSAQIAAVGYRAARQALAAWQPPSGVAPDAST
jgi:predicted acylesterase/phospholipase RssA